MALSSSTVAEALRYAHSRLVRWRMAALWGLLVATRAVAAPDSLARLAAPALFLALATALLRLWDDLADLAHDRVVAPRRVLVTSADLRPFAAVAGAGLVLLAVMLFADPPRLAVYLGLLVGLGSIYHLRLTAGLPRPTRAALVLVKYPLLVYLAGAGPSTRAALSALGLYAVLLSYEWRDDAALRASPAHQVLLGALLAVTVIGVVLMAGETRS